MGIYSVVTGKASKPPHGCAAHPWGEGITKKAILFIDTKDNKKISVALEVGGKKDEVKKTASVWTSQLLLPLIDELLKRNKISVSQVNEIKVETGPGSFTGLRVGIAVANTLGWLLSIPVNGRKDKLSEPVYQ